MRQDLRELLEPHEPEERSRLLLKHLEAGEEALDLQHADFANLKLPRARLVGADLRHAQLAGATLGMADLTGSVLEEADLQRADLAGAVLRGARLGSADLREALLDEADLTGASLRFARLEHSFLEHTILRGADLWGAQAAHAALIRADLQETLLHETDLTHADLSRADLRQATLDGSNFTHACMKETNLIGATLHSVNFRDANLQGAQLQGLDLTKCDLTHIWLSDAALEKTRLHEEQLGGAVGEELAKEYSMAQRAYLALERNFQLLGEPDASSWAYRRKRRMQKLAARKRGSYVLYVGDQLVEWVCDYGESVGRVLLSMLLVYVLFAALYGVTGSVMHVEGTRQTPTRSVLDLLVFSLLAMTTSGSPAVGLVPRNASVQLLTGLQALLGIFLTGLLGFVLGNRIRR